MGYDQNWKLCMILLVFINLLALVRAQDQNPYVCMRNGNYTSNSTYRANLNTLLSSLSSNMDENGFYNASVGQNPDRVNAIVLCRGDVPLDQCRSCVQNAAGGLVELCPNQKQAIIWYELCMLRYSNEPIYGTQTNDPGYELGNNASVPSPDQFRENRTWLLDDLRVHSANGSSVLKVAAGSRNLSNSETLYVLVQCTPDLSLQDCDNCLDRAVQSIRSCCDTAAGLRMLRPSCNLRYELYSFYNETKLREIRALLPPASSPPPGTKDNNTGGKKDDNTTKIVIIIVVTIVACLILAGCGAVFLKKRIKERWREIPDTAEEIGTVESLQYDFGKIRAATDDFADANKLGQGGFGAVYRGKLPNGQEIAVKRLSRDSGQGSMEFKNEVSLVAKLQHRNLVRLLGFSLEGTERLLIYEFVENASLDQFIFGNSLLLISPNINASANRLPVLVITTRSDIINLTKHANPIKHSHLDWDRRYKIIGGIVRGLLYLHEDSRLRIIHRDLKASNILLDREMNPKIADFGMARLFGQDETRGNTSKIVGTYGYMSPEYAMHGQFSVKSDVFSFGVLVLEIISGQKNNYIEKGEKADDLLSFTWKNWRNGTAANIIDPILKAGRDSLRDMLRCIHIALLCVRENAADRPTMTSIILMLNGFSKTLPVPREPAFFMASHFGTDNSLFLDYDSNSSKASRIKASISEGSSQNEVSITELYPR